MPSPFDVFCAGLDWDGLKALTGHRQTPFLLLSLERIKTQYRTLRDAFPTARVFYALKANPDLGVIATLRDLGGCFELASRNELELVRGLGVSGERCAFGNTIKKEADIAAFHAAGVRLFATDSEADVRKLAKAAPGARVYVRLLAEPSATADWPLDRKFGCPAEMAVEILLLAREKGLEPYGVSFHVGSQQKSPEAWGVALRNAARVFRRLKARGIGLQLINLGGGLPVSYLEEVPRVQDYADVIQGYLSQYFPEAPTTILEPGRFLVAEAGLLVSEVMLVSRKRRDDPVRWVYTDVGVFGGLTEAGGEATKYAIRTERGGEIGAVILAGPTCDGRDILYEKHRYRLPLDLRDGDRLYWLNAGAYTLSCGCEAYNGFEPIRGFAV